MRFARHSMTGRTSPRADQASTIQPAFTLRSLWSHGVVHRSSYRHRRDDSGGQTVIRRSSLVAALVLSLALVAGACSSSKSSTSTSGGNNTNTTAVGASDSATLSGAGSTFVNTILQEWVKTYKSTAPHVTINYQGVGSGAGIQQLTGKTVDFAGSDVALKPDEAAKLGGADATLQIPWIAGGIAVEYNLSGVSNLKLSGGTLAGLFAGKIQKWN